MTKRTLRHQRYRITGFRMLIPVGKTVKPERMLQVCQEHLTKLFWASELAGHTKVNLDDCDLGQFRAMVLKNDPQLKKVVPVDPSKSPNVTKYSFSQATRFTTQYGDTAVNPDWLKVFKKKEVLESLKDSPIN